MQTTVITRFAAAPAALPLLAGCALHQGGQRWTTWPCPEKATVVALGSAAAIGDQVWQVDEKHPVDRCGNVLSVPSSSLI